MERIITLTSDFGLKDGYVGIMKSVITTINPASKLIDITHFTPSFNLRAARFLLERSYSFLPPDAIHLFVVDPGVGSSRRAILVNSKKGRFIGPDNGVFSPILSDLKNLNHVRVISNEAFSLSNISSTFHGRDIFAPAAGYLSCGLPEEDFGEVIENYKVVKDPKSNLINGQIKGEIQYIDNFGNLISNIPLDMIEELNKPTFYCSGQKCRLVKSYYEGQTTELNVLRGSHGYLEFFCKENSASEHFRASVGDMIEIVTI